MYCKFSSLRLLMNSMNIAYTWYLNMSCISVSFLIFEVLCYTCIEHFNPKQESPYTLFMCTRFYTNYHIFTSIIYISILLYIFPWDGRDVIIVSTFLSSIFSVLQVISPKIFFVSNPSFRNLSCTSVEALR